MAKPKILSPYAKPSIETDSFFFQDHSVELVSRSNSQNCPKSAMRLKTFLRMSKNGCQGDGGPVGYRYEMIYQL